MLLFFCFCFCFCFCCGDVFVVDDVKIGGGGGGGTCGILDDNGCAYGGVKC